MAILDVPLSDPVKFELHPNPFVCVVGPGFSLNMVNPKKGSPFAGVTGQLGCLSLHKTTKNPTASNGTDSVAHVVYMDLSQNEPTSGWGKNASKINPTSQRRPARNVAIVTLFFLQNSSIASPKSEKQIYQNEPLLLAMSFLCFPSNHIKRGSLCPALALCAPRTTRI